MRRPSAWVHTRLVPTDIRGTYADTARCCADLVDRIPPDAWDGPGLGEWDLRSLVGHTSRALSTVITYLPRPAAAEQVPSTAAYFQLALGSGGTDPAAVTDRGRAAGVALGPEPAAAVNVLVAETIATLDAEPGDPVIQTIAGGIRLSNYLPTRTFELTVHTLDIAAATGLPVTPPPQALRDALRIAVELVDLRGDAVSVLRALTGRQPLPDGFSVV